MTKKCFDCNATLEWVGRGPVWMKSKQWDATKAGDYFNKCPKASHSNGNCYFDDVGGGETLKVKP